MLVDSHCHLDRLDLAPYNGDLDLAVDAANQAGVGHILCVAIDLPRLSDVLDIAERYEHIHASVGVHPLERADNEISIKQLVELAQHPKVVAIGETGLDYYYSRETIDIQQKSFIDHLKAARECNKPVIIHSRDAREDTLTLMAEHADHTLGGVMHCFTENWDMAQRAIEMNFYISLSGIVTFKNATELKEVAKKIPLERLLIETDSPYLAPIPYRGKPNEPKYVTHVAQCIADLREIDVQEVAEATTDNYMRLFGIDGAGVLSA